MCLRRAPLCVGLWLALVQRYLFIRLTWPENGSRFKDFSMAERDLARYALVLHVMHRMRGRGRMGHDWALASTAEPQAEPWEMCGTEGTAAALASQFIQLK
jgi:hypothetical protein